MSLASILYPAPTERGLEEWSYANFQHHLAINSAIRSARNIDPTLFQIWPIAPRNFQGWLRQHQQQHDEMNAVLGVPGVDLSAVDWNDRNQRDAWLFSHFLSHQAAAQAVGMGT